MGVPVPLPLKSGASDSVDGDWHSSRPDVTRGLVCCLSLSRPKVDHDGADRQAIESACGMMFPLDCHDPGWTAGHSREQGAVTPVNAVANRESHPVDVRCEAFNVRISRRDAAVW